MEAKIGNFPWSNDDIILGCEREVAEAESSDSDEHKVESIMRLSWALVHSRQRSDVYRGMAIVDASFTGSSPPFQLSSLLQLREMFYLLAVGEYRTNDYFLSHSHLYECLQFIVIISASLLLIVSNYYYIISFFLDFPDWSQALSLKKTITKYEPPPLHIAIVGG
ncbi:hypothetical protein UlMin_006341 [Ulmus minor]